MRGLYVITSEQHVAGGVLPEAVEKALIGGASVVQYRDKRPGHAPAERQLNEIHSLCRDYGALLLINDDVELARSVNADGVHLGRDDMDPQQARQHLGANKLIGVSCYGDIGRVGRMIEYGADYLALGRFYPSKTKPGATPVAIDTLKQVRAMTDIPLVAIGGITAQNGTALIEAGADMLAVVNGVFGHPDITGAARDISALFLSQTNQDEL
jgi:thiamine-phosphate pyrophosphorylase